MVRIKDNPPVKWPAAPLSGDVHRWTVAYCKPRQEKALAWDLVRREVRYFLPMVLRQTSSGGRRRRNYHPLFPSYVFFAGDDQARLQVLKTDRVVRLIEIHDARQPEFCDELAYLEQALETAPESIELYPRLVPGARVRIVAGALKDVQGVIVEAHDKRRLWLGVSVLGVGATVEIHADFVEVD